MAIEIKTMSRSMNRNRRIWEGRGGKNPRWIFAGRAKIPFLYRVCFCQKGGGALVTLCQKWIIHYCWKLSDAFFTTFCFVNWPLFFRVLTKSIKLEWDREESDFNRTHFEGRFKQHERKCIWKKKECSCNLLILPLFAFTTECMSVHGSTCKMG